MFDFERIVKQAVQPTLDTLLRLEKRLSRSCRSIMAQIRAHLIEPDYSVEKLMIDVGSGENNWPRSAFKAALDITPWCLIQEGRLETAARLLRDTPWQVGDIVIFVGYSDMTAFGRLFRRWCDMCPSYFRERTAAAEKHAGSIPPGVFTWLFWRRFRRQELTEDEAGELLVYFEKLYPEPPPP